ncbi:MAG: hypothetical protein HYR56_09600 [Acidobacteria bacterium]|nr:hypothetical protein [Acidobacteriota bacterium]
MKRLPYTFLMAMCAVLLCSAVAVAQDPNDIKTGSVLFFSRYTSDSSDPRVEDTQLNLTNTNTTQSVTLHLFAVEGNSCSVADSFISLTPNQTAQFFASDFDPGVQGYLVAVAFSGFAPRQFNYLTGTAYIWQADGRQADLPAIAVPKLNGAVIDNGDGTVNLNFDGANYGRLPGTVALSNFNSQVTDQTSVYIYSPRNLLFGDSTAISVFTLIYNDRESSGSTSFSARCYTEVELRNLRVIGTLNGFIPAGSVGWMKMSASRPLLGASLSTNGQFAGGRNLTCLSLFSSWTVVVPGGL